VSCLRRYYDYHNSVVTFLKSSIVTQPIPCLPLARTPAARDCGHSSIAPMILQRRTQAGCRQSRRFEVLHRAYMSCRTFRESRRIYLEAESNDTDRPAGKAILLGRSRDIVVGGVRKLRQPLCGSP
jgi:hypothetical protein